MGTSLSVPRTDSKLIWALWGGFGGTHMIMSHPGNREKFVEQSGGEKNFLGIYSIVSLGFFLPMTGLYIRSRYKYPVRVGIPGPRMLASYIFTFTGAGMIGLMNRPATPKSEGNELDHAIGIEKVTRHPLFCGLGLIGLGQSLTTPIPAQIAFWAGFPIFYIIGGMHQDYRTSLNPKKQEFLKETSLLPGIAIQQGRNTLKPEELNTNAIGISTAVTAALFAIKFFVR